MKQMACTECGHVGTAVPVTLPQKIASIMLLLTFVVPGAIYVTWLYYQRMKCPRCLRAKMIPADTPRGSEIVRNAMGKGGGFGSKAEYQRWRNSRRS